MLVLRYWRGPGWGAGQRPRGFESFPLRSSIHGQTTAKDTNTNGVPEPQLVARTPAFRSVRFFRLRLGLLGAFLGSTLGSTLRDGEH